MESDIDHLIWKPLKNPSFSISSDFLHFYCLFHSTFYCYFNIVYPEKYLAKETDIAASHGRAWAFISPMQIPNLWPGLVACDPVNKRFLSRKYFMLDCCKIGVLLRVQSIVRLESICIFLTCNFHISLLSPGCPLSVNCWIITKLEAIYCNKIDVRIILPNCVNNPFSMFRWAVMPSFLWK